MKVLVITGGNSDEKEISFISAGNVGKALLRDGHTVEMFDFARGYDELLEKAKNNDVVFPVLHGEEGEGGDLQEFLEKNNIKFVGPGSKASKNGWPKFEFKIFCEENSILTPRWMRLSEKNFKELDSFGYPMVIKPSNAGSSVDTFILKNKKDSGQVDFNILFKKYGEVLVEEFIDGVEITVGMLGDEPLPVVEIIPPEGEWFNYENKYSGKTKELAPAPSLSEEIKKQAQEITKKIHQGLGCRHYSRADFIIRGDNIFALEINMIPGLTPESLLPKAAKAAGFSFEQMVDKLVEMASL